MSNIDFSCIPCAGKLCFPKDFPERKACTQRTHECPLNVWQCRCCDECLAYCTQRNLPLKDTAHAPR